MTRKKPEPPPLVPSEVTFRKMRNIMRLISRAIIGACITVAILSISFIFRYTYGNDTEEQLINILTALGVTFSIAGYGIIGACLAIMMIAIWGYRKMAKEKESEPNVF